LNQTGYPRANYREVANAGPKSDGLSSDVNNLTEMKLSLILLLVIALMILSVALWELGKLRLILREGDTALE